MENKKIGIITIVYAENYGAVLQCYALKQFLLNRYTTNICVLDYHSDADKIGYGIVYNTLLKKHQWKQYAKYLLKLPFVLGKKAKRKKVFESFRNTYLNPQRNDNLDIIIYGSDQIWAYAHDFGGYNRFYWGDYFSAKKKIAYSASMGEITNVDNTFIAEHICNFDRISVREMNLQIFLSDFYSKKIPVTLDPTLLLDYNLWNSFAGNKKLFDEEYILVYNLNGNDVIKRTADMLSKEKKMKIVEILGHPKIKENSFVKSTFSPQEFVTLFKYASYVLTSSFHGTVFSLIFKKNFLVSQKNNTKRVMTLLSSFGFEDRFIEQENILAIDEVDYSSFDSQLKTLRESSESYLINSIERDV